METENEQLPMFEGYTFPKHVINFAGQISLDPSNAEEAELIEALHLGEEVTLTMLGTVTSRKHSLRADYNKNESMSILTVERVVRSSSTLDRVAEPDEAE